MSSMTQRMVLVERMALRGLDVDQIMARGMSLSQRTVSSIVDRANAAAGLPSNARVPATLRRPAVSPASRPELARLIAECALDAGVSVERFLAHSRQEIIAFARQEAMFLAMIRTTASTAEIADAFERDQKTIRHGACAHASRAGLSPPRGLLPVPVPKRSGLRAKPEGAANGSNS